MTKICCIGAGYVGGPTMAMIAKQCPHVEVNVVDINEVRIAAWQTDDLPIFEPGLLEVVQEARGRNLFFSTEVDEAIRQADIIFVSVNTPTKTFGEGAGYASDLQYWELCARRIKDVSTSDKIIVEKSTLPVRTAEAMERVLHAGENPVHFEVLSNPEFLAEGTAMEDLQCPDRVLIGGHETEAGKKAIQTLVDIYATWIPNERILTTNLWSAELSKLTANAFLAQRVSSINAISALCEATEADVAEVAHAIGTDSRIGPKFLKASIGFGGSCFKKDILNLVYLCETYGLQVPADYWRQVVIMNEYQESRFVTNMLHSMFNTIANKRIAVFGFAFKADTGDTRESPAIKVCRELAAEHATIVVSDPEAMENAKLEMPDLADQIEFEADPYQAAKGAHAIAVLTDWALYKELDFQRIYDQMQKPAFLFDGRNMLDHNALFEIGFEVYSIGKGFKTHLK
ncbi:MAG: UDP-glucose 6-dehydrogenase [Pontiella sp.]